MSTVVFEGNTYIFGATVSANPGTGTTSYVFGGLNAGTTYGFIIWAFNSEGTSSIVGPTSIVTLSEIPEEIRPMIAALDWSSAYEPVTTYWKYVDPNPINNINYITSSIDLTPTSLGGTWWTILSGVTTSVTTGFTAPDGSTTAWELKVTSTSSGNYWTQNTALPQGKTFYLSYYRNLIPGSTKSEYYPSFYWEDSRFPTGICIPPRQQILPVTGIMTTSGGIVAGAGGQSGWVRFAYQFYSSYGVDYPLFRIRMFDIESSDVRYYWGPQLEEAT